ncbi:sulfurtransferase [uncultured Enterovirga sp.]|uniref:sulfurtransferase n=1 Tax=uncultured Enterovirga sp. TaxID=2026352 RepID=UPI0035CB1B4C
MPGISSALIDPQELAAKLGAPDLVLLDIRSAVDGGGRAAYDAGHIPGAVHTDYVTGGWRASRNGGAGMLPEADALGALFGRLGIVPASDVVVIPAGVSAGDFAAASRVYWTLKAAGHHHLSLLDGGYAAWAASGLPVETAPGEPRTAPDYPVAFDPSLRALAPDVEQAMTDGSAILVDTRNQASFEGLEQSKQAARPGRIPGSLHLEGARAYDTARNRLKPRAELEQLFGAAPGRPVIPYCNTGQQAATNWFVLSEILGQPDVRLYDGSLSEWTHDPARPVETGPAERG